MSLSNLNDLADEFNDSWFSIDLFSDHITGGNLSSGLLSSQNFSQDSTKKRKRKSTTNDSSQVQEVPNMQFLAPSSSSSPIVNSYIQASELNLDDNSRASNIDFSSDDDSDGDLDFSEFTSDDMLSKKDASMIDATDITDITDFTNDSPTMNLKAKVKNREHAKNTRMRKKNYIETLKDTVQHLAQERENLDKDRRFSLTRLAEQCTVRKKVLQAFFTHRANNEKNRSKWSSVLDESFRLVIPVTPYRSFPPSEVVNAQRHVIGIDAVIMDTASLSVMIQSIGNSNFPDKRVKVHFILDFENIVMSGDTCFCRWEMRTENAIECGSHYECYKQGMLKAVFNHQNKLLSIEKMFDVMAFMQQLRRASGKNEFQVIPNTLETALEPTRQARVITFSEKPFFISHINPSWTAMCGFKDSDVEGKTCKILQGPDSDFNKIADLMADVHEKRPHTTVLTNYNVLGEKMKNSVSVFPLYDSATHVTHFIAIVDIIHENLDHYQNSSLKHKITSHQSGTAPTTRVHNKSLLRSTNKNQSNNMQSDLNEFLNFKTENKIPFQSKTSPCEDKDNNSDKADTDKSSEGFEEKVVAYLTR